MTIPHQAAPPRRNPGVAAAGLPSERSAELADLVAAAVRAVPGVADLHAGVFGEVGTYLPGGRVPGIRLENAAADVHVSIYFGASARETAHRVRGAVSELVGGTVNVTVEDVVPILAGSPLGVDAAGDDITDSARVREL